MVKIIYDSAITGHHTEYINHLVNYVVDSKSEDKYYFIVSAELKVKFPEIINKSKEYSSIIWEFIPEARVKKIHGLSLAQRSFAELALVEEYAKKLAVKDVCLLYFNIFQIALIFKRTSFNIKGILFLQFFRMAKDNWRSKLKYYRKYVTTKLCSYNSKITTVFILNDQTTVDYLNSEFKTTKFRMLPDPIPVYNEEEGFDLYNYYNIPKNKKILLHPGAIDPRKGTYEIIEAVDFLQSKETNEYAILIVGKAKTEIETVIQEKFKTLKNKKFIIVFDNTFVTSERLKSLFVQSYAVLMPYKNPEASSGILGHAAIANKCVLAPDSGLIGDIIKTHKLGVLINMPIAIDIAKGIERLCNCTTDNILATEFVSDHSVEVFSRSLLK